MNQKAGLFLCVSEWADKNKSQMGRSEMASEKVAPLCTGKALYAGCEHS